MKKIIVLKNKTTINKINNELQYRNIIDIWDLPFKKEQLHNIITHCKQRELINDINHKLSLNIDLNECNELIYYDEIHNENDIISIEEINYKKSIKKSKIYSIILREIKNKISGYHQQDKNKNIYIKEYIISLCDTVELLVESQLLCSYCKKQIYILYSEYRDNNQWTLDRVDNDKGHHKDNCVISCLSCNLKKRRMDDDKFRFTKQMKIIKKN